MRTVHLSGVSKKISHSKLKEYFAFDKSEEKKMFGLLYLVFGNRYIKNGFKIVFFFFFIHKILINNINRCRDIFSVSKSTTSIYVDKERVLYPVQSKTIGFFFIYHNLMTIFSGSMSFVFTVHRRPLAIVYSFKSYCFMYV